MRRLFGKEARERAREYWKHLMESTRLKMSVGASYIAKILTVAHGDGWRRNKNHKK